MSIFRKKNDKETVALWKKEAKRLEKERNQLYTQLETIKGYKQQYQGLITEVSELKDTYSILVQQTESIGNEYKEKLQAIVEKT